MFKTRRTKIVSAPVEEVLEVSAPEPVVEPEPITVYNIERLSVFSDRDDYAQGELYDSNDNVYKYFWDKKLKRISSLTSNIKIDYLAWNLCDQVLNKYFVRPEPVKQEQPVEVKIAEALKVALGPLANNIKSLESKVSNIKTAPPAPVQAAPRPTVAQSMPVSDTPAINVADNDISTNAMRFLQQAKGDDLGIDYMSL